MLRLIRSPVQGCFNGSEISSFQLSTKLTHVVDMKGRVVPVFDL